MNSSNTFVDEAHVTVVSGDGGDGIVVFRREKYVPRGGPSGGDGGRGGDVAFVADANLNTLTELQYRKLIRAGHGERGGGSNRTGCEGETVEVRIPVGTVVYDDDAAADAPPLVDLSQSGQRVVVAYGGKGGLGNARFATPTRQAPDFALPGKPGETRRLRLSLKLLADVGLVGFPNAGKSTLLRRISAARPRVASYPFTTLKPSLGVVEHAGHRFVVADIPGLIEGASEGAGLGHRFLRHIERTRVIVHLLDVGAHLMEGRDLLADYEVIRRELGRYQASLLARREIVVLNKIDLLADRSPLAEVERELTARGIAVMKLSGATGEGTRELVRAMLEAVEAAMAAEQAGSGAAGGAR